MSRDQSVVDSRKAMNVLRIVVLTGAAALAAAWLSSAAATRGSETGSGSAVDLDAASSVATVSPVVGHAELERQMARLSGRFEQAPRPRFSARNPFVLAAHMSVNSTRTPTTTIPSDPGPAAVASGVVGAPAVSLAGIATDRTSAGVRLTAILSADNRIFIVLAGDEILGRYGVRVIAVDSVELFDLKERTSLHLTLP